MDKRGQVTVFIILGIIILVSVIMLITLRSKIEVNKLQEQKQNQLIQIFKKEALNLYLSDCLQDNLEYGLDLIGKQGRLWVEDPGGIKNFEQDVTGTLSPSIIGEGEDKIFYAIKRKKYNLENTYPCDISYDDESKKPYFCKYPQQSVTYGDFDLYTSTITGDLRRFLVEESKKCVEKFVDEEVSKKVNVDEKSLNDIDLQLDLISSGISVKADLPIKLKLADEELYHLAHFEFFYESNLANFLHSAIAFPMQEDWSDMDFEYSEDVLLGKKGSYINSEIYKTLSAKMLETSLANGDQVFRFSVPGIYKDKNKIFYFSMARQNRPPALEYINRLACPEGERGYDYLVILDDDNYKTLNIEPNAKDPDEDEVKFLVEVTKGSLDLKKLGDKWVTIPTNPGMYEVKVIAKDEHLKDWQNVRVLVDSPINTELKVRLPDEYASKISSVIKMKDQDYYIISREDPVYLDVTLPKGTGIKSRISTVFMNYQTKEGKDKLEHEFKNVEKFISNNFCVGVGLTTDLKSDVITKNTCNWNEYKNGWIKNWNDFYDNDPQIFFRHFDELGEGQLIAIANVKYCGLDQAIDPKPTSVVNTYVVSCLPYKNEEYPYPAPYHWYKKTKDGWINDPNSNPFLATHACCIGDPKYPERARIAKPEDKVVCFENPVIDCYGKINGFTTIPKNKGVIQETVKQYCDGTRGNYCGGEFVGTFRDDKMICGNPKLQRSCDSTKINSNCYGIDSFGLSNNGWCYGNLGCSDFCNENNGGAIVKVGGYDFNQLAKIAAQVKAQDEKQILYECGCNNNNLDYKCDANFDGIFEGTCKKVDDKIECSP